MKTTKETLSALKSSPKQVVEQEITHVRNKNRGINTEYVSLRQDRPKTRITGLRTREQRWSQIVTSSTTCTCISTTGFSEPVPQLSELRFYNPQKQKKLIRLLILLWMVIFSNVRGGGKIKYHWMLGVFLKYNLIKIDKFIYLRLSPMPSK